MTCKDCGATVTVSDRFCPACGTPNSQCKFHPKFGPALKIVEPRIITEPAPAGSPSCPRCHRLIADDQEYCRGCGMELEVAWERLHRVEALDVLAAKGELAPYRSPGRLGLVLQAALSASVLMAMMVGLGNFWLYARSTGRVEQGLSTPDVMQLLDSLSLVMVGSLVISYLVLVAWMWRCYRNLPALAVGDLRFGQGWVVAGWLLPIVNLIRPKQIVDDLWRGSHPMAPPLSASWRVGPTTAWSMTWWSGLLLGLALGTITKLVQPGGVVVASPSVAPALALGAASGLVLAGSSLSLRLLVQRISERQDTRAVFVLEPGSELDADDEPFSLDDLTIVRPEPAVEPILLVQPSSRDAVYGKY